MSRKNTLQKVKFFIEKQYCGSIVLSTSYTNNTSKLKIQCPHNHIFLMSLKGVRKGSRCPTCRSINQSKRQTLTFDFVRNQIMKIHPNCQILSNFYKNNKYPIIIKCEKGHIFQNDYDHIVNSGQWCSECSPSKPLTKDFIIGLIKEKYPKSKIQLENYKFQKTYPNSELWNEDKLTEMGVP